MKQLNNYILEKLHLTKNIVNANTEISLKDFTETLDTYNIVYAKDNGSMPFRFFILGLHKNSSGEVEDPFIMIMVEDNYFKNYMGMIEGNIVDPGELYVYYKKEPDVSIPIKVSTKEFDLDKANNFKYTENNVYQLYKTLEKYDKH